MKSPLIAFLTTVLCCTSAAQASNLLANPGFEAGLDDWVTFSNVFTSGDPVLSGAGSAVILGGFDGNPAFSGLFQNTAASEGDIFEASIFAINDSSITNNDGNPDIIAGSNNVVNLVVEWFDAGGGNLGGASETTIFDGSDPNLILDDWVETSLISDPAPAGTAEARFLVIFVQSNFAGGLVHLEDASFTRIPEPGTVALAAAALVGGATPRRRRS